MPLVFRHRKVPFHFFSNEDAPRENYLIGHSGNGLHLDELDEDISVEGLLTGRADETDAGSQAA